MSYREGDRPQLALGASNGILWNELKQGVQAILLGAWFKTE
ncbi:MAG: hypothetical protein AB4426_12655 [Xenococcaceae cyanobacterium]